jgi:PQ loop repeat
MGINMSHPNCGPGAVQFVAKWFSDCLYTYAPRIVSLAPFFCSADADLAKFGSFPCRRRDVVGFSFGMASIGCWLFAQLPQFVLNIKNESAEALSAWFLAEWLLVRLLFVACFAAFVSIAALIQSQCHFQGDTCNLVGCLLTGDQLPTTTYTAMHVPSPPPLWLLCGCERAPR